MALIVPDVTNPFFGHVMRCARAAAWRAGYTVALVDTANDRAWELSSYEALRGGPVDGFLVFGIEPPRRRRGARGEKVVLIEAELPGHPSVRLDTEAGADAVMAHLLGPGHRRIGRVARRRPIRRPRSSATTTSSPAAPTSPRASCAAASRASSPSSASTIWTSCPCSTRLAAHMAGERVPRVRMLPVALTVRGSTAPPPDGRPARRKRA